MKGKITKQHFNSHKTASRIHYPACFGFTSSDDYWTLAALLLFFSHMEKDAVAVTLARVQLIPLHTVVRMVVGVRVMVVMVELGVRVVDRREEGGLGRRLGRLGRRLGCLGRLGRRRGLLVL